MYSVKLGLVLAGSKSKNMETFVEFLPGLGKQLRPNILPQSAGNRPCRVELPGMFVPFGQGKIVQLRLCLVQSFLHGLEA